MKVWSYQQAQAWYEKTAWQVGMNYLPSTAVNSTEMWQNESFDEATIRRELAWAGECGYNSIRVFLPFIVWENEGRVFMKNFETLLQIADQNGLSVLPILFDDCAFDQNRDPFLGKQDDPVPGLHNSRWTPSPGFAIADNPTKQSALREYVHALVGTYKDDSRIVAWDLYNEPGNTARSIECLPLLVNCFKWARECEPSQPLTAAVWDHSKRDSTYLAMCELSDVIGFHTYETIEKTKEIVEFLSGYQKPLFVTEWLCREKENTFENHLPFFAENKISCWHWGFVVGKTQTNLWWSWGGMTDIDPIHPSIWQHDTVDTDGTIYRQEEMDMIKELRKAYQE